MLRRLQKPIPTPRWNIGPHLMAEISQNAITESFNTVKSGDVEQQFLQWLDQEARLLNCTRLIGSYCQKLPSQSIVTAGRESSNKIIHELVRIRGDRSLHAFLGDDSPDSHSHSHSKVKSMVAKHTLYPHIKDPENRDILAGFLLEIEKLQYDYTTHKVLEGEKLMSSEEYQEAMLDNDEDVRRRAYNYLVNSSYMRAKDSLACEIYLRRNKVARDLGFSSYLELSLSTRFLNTNKIRTWLDGLSHHHHHHHQNHKEPWNYLFDLRRSDSIIGSPKLPLEPTFQAILQLVSDIFGLKFTAQDTSENGTSWAAHVQLYSLTCIYTDEELGHVYFDLRKSAYKPMGYSTSVVRYRFYDQVLPVTCLTCNLADEIGILDVWSILHEFGHLLHEHLGEGVLPLPQFTGTNNACFSYIEVPSHTLERLTFTPTTLKRLGVHCEPLEAQKLQSYLDSVTNIEDMQRTKLDLAVHGHQFRLPQDLPKDLPKGHSMLHHIVTDGYEAAYFVYLLARQQAPEMLSHVTSFTTGIGVGNMPFSADVSRTSRSVLFNRGVELDID